MSEPTICAKCRWLRMVPCWSLSAYPQYQWLCGAHGENATVDLVTGLKGTDWMPSCRVKNKTGTCPDYERKRFIWWPWSRRKEGSG